MQYTKHAVNVHARSYTRQHRKFKAIGPRTKYWICPW